MNIPENLFYTKDHEYVKVENGVGIIGITDYAQGELGDIIYVDITGEAGSDVNQHDSVGSIEAVKTVSEVFTPVSGKIIGVNSGINDNASVLNSDPYGEGWIVKIELSNTEELNGLLDAKAYKELVGA
ncbi:MAG: glycine cleavage system protein GcvH [Ignavibacteriae bacterium]|nr:glycine cleavage system protein GcvH [Ignavibacteriota bacterium]